MAVKITPQIKSEASKIFKANKEINTLFVNNKGEFFTSRNLADNSVKKPSVDVTEIPRAALATIESEEEEKEDKSETKPE